MSIRVIKLNVLCSGVHQYFRFKASFVAEPAKAFRIATLIALVIIYVTIS